MASLYDAVVSEVKRRGRFLAAFRWDGKRLSEVKELPYGPGDVLAFADGVFVAVVANDGGPKFLPLCIKPNAAAERWLLRKRKKPSSKPIRRLPKSVLACLNPEAKPHIKRNLLGEAADAK